MAEKEIDLDFDAVVDSPAANRGGFVALTLLATAVGAGAALLLAPDEGARTRERVGRGLRNIRGEAAESISQLQRELHRRRNQSRSEKRVIGLAGLLIGAGLAALLTPSTGADTRKRLGGTLSRIKVGTVDRIDRIRQRPQDAESREGETPVRTVQELGRDPNTVF
jgi:gas vesicle protein